MQDTYEEQRLVLELDMEDVIEEAEEKGEEWFNSLISATMFSVECHMFAIHYFHFISLNHTKYTLIRTGMAFSMLLGYILFEFSEKVFIFTFR